LVYALPREDQIQLEPFVRLLDQADLIGLVGGEEIAAYLSCQRQGAENYQESLHFFFPMMPVISRS
jgi:hypothetical protein